MGSGLSLCKIFVLFGKKIVLLITLSFKLDGYVKIVFNFHPFPKREEELGEE